METNNMTAMREALEMFVDAYRATSYSLCIENLRPAYQKADAALSAPPRNCDRFADELDAQLAFLNEVWLISIDRESMTEQDEYDRWTDEMRKRYGRWLLAPTTVEEGESDGR